MSYHRSGLGMPPAFTPTTAFAQAVDPYSWRMSPPGAAYSPYGWGPDFMVGMPFNYTHHIGYERTPIPGARRVGPMYDTLSGIGSYEGDSQRLGDAGDSLGGLCGSGSPEDRWNVDVCGAQVRCWLSEREAVEHVLSYMRGQPRCSVGYVTRDGRRMYGLDRAGNRVSALGDSGDGLGALIVL